MATRWKHDWQVSQFKIPQNFLAEFHKKYPQWMPILNRNGNGL